VVLHRHAEWREIPGHRPESKQGHTIAES
jgi:hypothetical protein